jgi:hypothetical protein
MIVQATTKLFVSCPTCKKGEFRIDQIPVGAQYGPWECRICYAYAMVRRLSSVDTQIDAAEGRKQTPITVTLQSRTEPKIILKLNAWKYEFSQNNTPEEFQEHERYYYNEHTCPTNFVSQIEQIIFEGDRDPHGVFEFVSVEDGHIDED